MSNRKTLLAMTALATLSGGMALAVELPQGQVTRQVIETAFEGYEYIDIRFGRTQVKVEAVDNDTGQKIEAIFVKATGALLETELEAAGDDAGRSGTFVRSLTRDFTDSDDDTSDDDTNDMSTDDDTNDNSGSDDDSSGDESSGDDDSGDDDSGNDDSGDDRSDD